jgi:hypothetical protein
VALAVAVSTEDWSTVGWSMMAVGLMLLIVWLWLSGRRR